jgi:single-strand DNA-binding protein
MLNCFLGIGRLGRDAELITTRNGDPMARFSLAIDRIRPKGQTGDPDWIVCHLFGDRARSLAPYLTRGTLIGVRGRLESFHTTGEESRRLMRIDVSEVNFLRRPLAANDAATAPMA